MNKPLLERDFEVMITPYVDEEQENMRMTGRRNIKEIREKCISAIGYFH